MQHAVRMIALAAIVVLAGGSLHAQDVATVGSVTANGTTVAVPFYVRDVSGTSLGRDQASGSRIQGLSFKVSYSPAAAVSTVSFARAGITASLTPIFETTVPSGNTISYIGSFNETTSLIPFTLDKAAPGDQVLQLTFGLSASATPGTVITLAIDSSSSVTLLSNQAGTVSESVGNAKLTLVNGSITVPAAAPTVTGCNPSSGPTTGGTPVSISGTNFQNGATVSIGGVAATGVGFIGSTSLSATTGAHAAGAANVVVTNPDAQSGTLSNGYTYTAVSSGSADLSLAMSDAPDPLSVGTSLTYTIVVANAGPDEATGVSMSDQLPIGTTYVSAISTQGSCSLAGNTLTWAVGSLSSGASATVTIVVIPTAGGQITNTSTVSGNESDPNSSNNSASAVTSVTGNTSTSADLHITKTGSPDPAAVGSNLTYLLVVTNGGPDDATGVSVTDVLPAAVSFATASTSQGTWGLNGSTVVMSLGGISKGASATESIVVIPTTAGQLQNTATVGGADSDPNPADNSSTATIDVETTGGTGADLTGIWKKVKKTGSTSVSARFVPQNTGNADAASFSVKFYLSSDQTVGSTDKLIQTSTVKNGLAAGASGKAIKLKYSSSKSISGKYLIAVVDAGGAVGESNETNNTVVKAIP